MEQILIFLCDHGWLSKRQLSDLTWKNTDNFTLRFLSRLVASDLLIVRFLNNPTHNDQAYATHTAIKT